MKKFLTETQVMDLIPNRFPIIYIDYVDEIESGKKIIATKNVTINEDFFQGHFPGNPVMPGALILETLAQAVENTGFLYIEIFTFFNKRGLFKNIFDKKEG